MAFCLSSPSLSTARSSHSSSSKPLKTLNSQIYCQRNPQLQFRFRFPPGPISIPRLGLSSPPLPVLRPVFQSYSSPEDFTPHTSNGKTEDSIDGVSTAEIDAELNPSSSSLPGIDTLVKAYKEAVLAGDEKSVSEIETLFLRTETEKKDFVHKISALMAELGSGKEKYIRLQADFDNFRKRSEKERLNVRSDAQRDVIESLLPMVDSFEQAKQQIRLETDKETKIDVSYQGIYKQLVEIMRSLGVATVLSVGKPFDPSVHEAIAREESEEVKDSIVIQEVRRGFILGHRLLRPAMVKVSLGPGKKKAVTGTSPKTTDQPIGAASADEN